jgi:hypothetical protein
LAHTNKVVVVKMAPLKLAANGTKQILYSRHRCRKLRKIVIWHDWS